MSFPTDEQQLTSLLDNMQAQNAPKSEMKTVIDTYISRSNAAVEQSQQEEPGFGERFKEQFVGGLGELAAPTVGAVKSAVALPFKGQRLIEKGGKALAKAVTGEEQQPEVFAPVLKALEPKSTGEKIGAFAEETAEFALPTSIVSKSIKGLKALKNIPKAAKVLIKSLGEGLTSAGVATIQEGEVGKEAAVAGGIAAEFPVGDAALKKVFKPLIDRGRLISKATGITSTLKSQIDDIAKSKIKVKGKTQSAYKSIDDFFVEEGFFKKGSQTTRDDFVQIAEDLLKATKGSKVGLVEGIKTKIPVKKIPDYKKILNELKEGFKTLGQEKKFAKIKGLIASKDKSISAADLEFVRSAADDLLFSATDKPKQEGLRNIIGKLRDILQDVETSGAVKKANVKIRILSKLLGVGKQTNPLKTAALKDPVGSVAIRLLGGAGAGATASFIPGAQALTPVLAAIGAAEAATSLPKVASSIVNILSKETGKKVNTELIATILKALAVESGVKITNP